MNTIMFSNNQIKQLCGDISYYRGLEYYRAGKVTELEYNDEFGSYYATVEGSGRKRYEVEIFCNDEDGSVSAFCSCPAYASYDFFCKHIAAVLLQMAEYQSSADDPSGAYFMDLLSSGVSEEMNELLAIMDDYTPENPGALPTTVHSVKILSVEFTLHPYSTLYHNDWFFLEMKVGPERLYVVPKIREFLKHIEHRSIQYFTKKFTYNPAEHVFKPEDWAAIEQLIEIARNEEEVCSALFGYMPRSWFSNERRLFIPPSAFGRLLPTLAETKTMIQVNHNLIEQIVLLKEEPPVCFRFGQVSDGYQFSVEGLDQLTIMESYGYIIDNRGYFIPVEPQKSKLLARLKRMFDGRKHTVYVGKNQFHSFLQRTLPKLKGIGQLSIDEKLADRIVYRPLTPKLYLDRTGERLLARLEFCYGELTFDPVKPTVDEIHFVLRDMQREKDILTLLEQCHFQFDGEQFSMTDEEHIYQFLFHHLPGLETKLEIYVTNAVRSVFHPDAYKPAIRAEVDAKTEWLEIRFDLEGIDESEIPKILRSIVEKKKYHRLPNGAFLSLETGEYRNIAEIIEQFGIRKTELKTKVVRRPAVYGLQLDKPDREKNHLILGKKLRQLLHNLKQPDQLDFPVPARLDPVLRDYQKHGFQWLKTLSHYRFGGVLADEMGLGKTLQSIAYLLSEHQEGKNVGLPSLVVAPASLIYNWYHEFGKFAPELKTMVISGSKKERAELLSAMTNTDVIITSYPLLRRDIESYAEFTFHALILDEAQTVKNYESLTAQAVNELKARQRFALTGTPIENSLDELWSIYETVFPGLFPERNAFHNMSRDEVARRIKPFMLRRVKTDVLRELPDKIESIDHSELAEEQKKLYIAYLSKLQKETAATLEADGFQKSRMKILAGLTRLRQLCCHPSLFVENYRGGSGKMERLLELVEECRSGGKRMLIFSQFTEMLKLIRSAFDRRGWSYFYLDGGTPAAERVEMCERFNEGQRDMFLISLRAGGTGLNLTGADTVILYDLWWNPAVEQQAADRAHRIGQKNVVHVIRMIARGTVEDKIYELQQRKRDLINEVIQSGGADISSLTEEEIRELLMI